MIEILFAITWTCLAAYIVWYFFIAKTVHPLSFEDLTLTWQLHKKQTGCTASSIHVIHVRNKDIVGFTCNCGHKFIQKRLITKVGEEPTIEKQLPQIKEIIKSDEIIERLGLKNTQIHQI